MKNYFKILLETSEKDNAMFRGALGQFYTELVKLCKTCEKLRST